MSSLFGGFTAAWVGLGNSPAVIRKPYAQWTGGTLFSQTKAPTAKSLKNKEENLVDGMGFEPTTPTLRTWCSPS
jgi:hypothetical protein